MRKKDLIILSLIIVMNGLFASGNACFVSSAKAASPIQEVSPSVQSVIIACLLPFTSHVQSAFHVIIDICRHGI